MKFLGSIFNFLRFNNRNWKAVVLCLITATVFWFFNALNKNYSANISFPLAFAYDEENYIPVKSLPHSIRLNVSGQGWDLFRKSLGVKIPSLNIPLEYPSEVKKIVGASLPPLFSPQIEGLQINFVLADTIHLQLDKKIMRKAFLAVDSVEQYLERGFGMSGKIIVRPDVVMLQGPQSLLNAFPDTILLSLQSRNINKPFNEEVEVDLKSELIHRNPPLVNVSFPVDRLMVITDTVALKVIHLPKGIRYSSIVNEVSYTYSLPIMLSGSINPDSVTAVLDLNGFTKGRHRLAPVLSGLPAYSRLINIDSVDINF